MNNGFEYLPKEDAKELKKTIISLINDVQDELRPDITFSYHIIGSLSRNMVTYQPKGNKGFDGDVDLYLQYYDEDLSPKQIKDKFMNAFRKHVKDYGFTTSSDSTRVITIKSVDQKQSKILYGVDFAIVREYVYYEELKPKSITELNSNYKNLYKPIVTPKTPMNFIGSPSPLPNKKVKRPCSQYIHFDKTSNQYKWENQPDGYNLDDKIDWLKHNIDWKIVKNTYLHYKNTQSGKSRSIYARCINDLYNQYHK